MSKKIKDKNKRKARSKTEAGNDNSEGPSPFGAAVSVKIAFAVAAVAVVVGGMYLLRQNVLTSSTRPADSPVRVHLADPPEWLLDKIARKIVADIQTAVRGKGVLDDNLTRDVFDAAAKNPWIAKVHKVTRQKDGIVLVRADFRCPFAIVAFRPLSPADVRVVDAEGVVLPLSPRLVNVRKILEITTKPPPAGKKWDSPQLADALKLLGLIKDKPYISLINLIEIKIINTRTHLVMYAPAGGGRRTKILFGRFPIDDLDYCVSPAVKISNLDRVVAGNAGVFDGIEQIDIQHDDAYTRRY